MFSALLFPATGVCAACGDRGDATELLGVIDNAEALHVPAPSPSPSPSPSSDAWWLICCCLVMPAVAVALVDRLEFVRRLSPDVGCRMLVTGTADDGSCSESASWSSSWSWSCSSASRLRTPTARSPARYELRSSPSSRSRRIFFFRFGCCLVCVAGVGLISFVKVPASVSGVSVSAGSPPVLLGMLSSLSYAIETGEACRSTRTERERRRCGFRYYGFCETVGCSGAGLLAGTCLASLLCQSVSCCVRLCDAIDSTHSTRLKMDD